VRIASDDVKMLKQFKREFDGINIYKSTIMNIQNKTFRIESSSKLNALEKSELDKEKDNQTCNQTIVETENNLNITRSHYANENNTEMNDSPQISFKKYPSNKRDSTNPNENEFKLQEDKKIDEECRSLGEVEIRRPTQIANMKKSAQNNPFTAE
jgi:hypothetical protein